MRQYARPVIISGNKSITAKRLQYNEREYTEKWLQDIVHNHPECLPISDIEPLFEDVISLCTEMEMESGFVDNVLINDRGYVTLVECKLWRNPQARREVLAQVLDYAKDLAGWNYDRFEAAVLKARAETDKTLLDIMTERTPDIDETEFIDSVNRNLKEARVLLLIIGDGIRENAEQLIDFLNSFANMRFVLAFVEMPVFKLEETDQFIITPRILAKTTELERVVIPEKKPASVLMKEREQQQSRSASESVFYERLASSIGQDDAKSVRAFVDELREEFDIRPKMGRGKTLALHLKTVDDRYNLGAIQEDGRVLFFGIVPKTGEAGDRQIGIDYLKGMAGIINGEYCDDYSEWNYCAKKNGEYASILEYLKVKEAWKELIAKTLERIKRLETE